MSTLHLTEIAVRALKTSGTYYDTSTPAFGLRVGKRRKTWFVIRGKARLRTIARGRNHAGLHVWLRQHPSRPKLCPRRRPSGATRRKRSSLAGALGIEKLKSETVLLKDASVLTKLGD
jgi:hypothetical protein